jgi:hypothetical protein
MYLTLIKKKTNGTQIKEIAANIFHPANNTYFIQPTISS